MKLVKARRSGSAAGGQALVEFTLIAPVLFLIIFGIVEAGRFVLYSHTLNHAAREGARYAIVHGSNSSSPAGPSNTAPITDAVQTAAFGLMNASDLTVSVCYFQYTQTCGTGTASNNRGDNVTVTASYSYAPIIGLLPPITLQSEATLVINN